VFALLEQPDGRILLAGSAAGNGALVRLDSDGSLDTSFGSGGVSQLLQGGELLSVQLLPNGRILALGRDAAGSFLLRVNADGSPDPSFFGTGMESLSLSADTMVLRPDDRIVIAGHTPDSREVVVTQLESDGTPDPSFGTNGTATVSFFGTPDVSVIGAALTGDGSIVVAGDFFTPGPNTTNPFVARLTSTGQLDTSFATTGEHVYDFGGLTDTAGIALEPDGRILFDASGDDGNSEFFLVTRLNTDGSVDPSFHGGQPDEIGFGSQGVAAVGLALQGDGRAVLAGAVGVGGSPSAVKWAAVRILGDSTTPVSPVLGISTTSRTPIASVRQTVTFTVTENGTPVPGATVGFAGARRVTGANGTVSFSVLRRHHAYTATATLAGATPTSTTVTPRFVAPLKLFLVTIRRRPGRPILVSFRVTWNGRPDRGATVTFAGRSATTSSRGGVSFNAHLISGHRYTATATQRNRPGASLTLRG
jgi:uncharacterized delta-60 repeat protein